MNVLLLPPLQLILQQEGTLKRVCAWGGGGHVQKFNLGLLPHISDVLVNLIVSTEVPF